MRGKLLLLGLAIAAILAWRCVVFVDQAQVVVITQFGQPVRVLNDKKDEAGLHFKLPYQSVIRIDKRLQIYDPKPSEFLTAEKKNLNLDIYVCWRVAEPLKFLTAVNDPVAAEARLHDVVWSQVAAELGKSSLEAIVSIDAQQFRLPEIIDTIYNRSRQLALDNFGIEIVDVRFKRISFPSQVRESVFNRMRAERGRMAAQYRAEGEEQSLKIRAEADKQRTVLLAQANAEAEKIRGQAEAEAIRVYAEAHARDPEFYKLVRTLEAYEKFLDEKTTILLPADSELFRLLMEGVKQERPTAPLAARNSPDGNAQ